VSIVTVQLSVSEKEEESSVVRRDLGMVQC